MNWANEYQTAGAAVVLTATPNPGYQFSGWSGGVTGMANPVTVTMDAPKAVTANFLMQNTIYSMVPVSVTVAGVGCSAGTYAAPVTFGWASGATCVVSFSSTQVVGDTRQVFSKWSDGSTANPRTLTAAPGTALTLEWKVEYRLTRAIAGSGTVNAADGFYAASSTVPLTATAEAGHQFSHWSGDASGSMNPLPVVMNGPKNITANFIPGTAQIVINSNVPSLQFTVSGGSGCAPGTYTAPVLLSWTQGSECSASVPSPQGGDVRWSFAGWTDGSSSNPRTIAVTSASYTMRFDTQYKLTRAVTGQGSVSGADGFYAAGSAMQLTAVPAAGYQFTGWSGNVVSTANPLAFTLESPSTITANFSATPAAVTFNGNVAAQFALSGTGCPPGNYTLPVSISWTSGVPCLVTIPSPQGGQDTRWVFSNWADGSSANPNAITAIAGAAHSLTFITEHKLTRLASGQGAVSGADGFLPAGTMAQLMASPAAGYQFTGWSGAASGAQNPLSVVMNGPKAITANFSAIPAAVQIGSNLSVNFTVSGAGCPLGTYTAPVALTWDSGVSCALEVIPPPSGSDSRWVFSRWVDGPSQNPRWIAASPGASYTISMALEYLLMRSASGGGSVSGVDGFYAAGSSLSLTASPADGYQFSGWSGSATGSANPLQVSMNGPKSITANFAAAATNVRIEANTAAPFSVSGAGCPAGSYTAPVTLSWTTGVSCTISVQPTSTGDGIRSVFQGWTDGYSASARPITASPGAVYAVSMAVEYWLTRAASGPGTVSGADGFYAAGSTLQLGAAAAAGYQFAGWIGSVNGAANPLSLVMNGPKTVTAHFTSAAVSVRIDSNFTAGFTMSGAGCPAGAFTAPADLAWTNGTTCTVSVVSPQVVLTQGGENSRLAFLGWLDGAQANPRNLTAIPGGVYTLLFQSEHRLTRLTAGSGTVSGADGFYAAGSAQQITATPAPGYEFSGWSGGAAGTSNPLTVSMNGPVTVTANFTPVVGASVGSLSPLTGSGYAGSYTATFSHGGGADQLYLGYVLFLPTPNVVNYVATGSCLVEYNRISHGMRLIDDAGTGWLGPIEGVVIRPGAGVLSNRQCTLNVAAAAASVSGNTMTLRVPVTFKNATSPVMATFLQALDVTGKWTGMTQFGNWTVANGTVRPGPAIVSAINSATAGTTATYTITASHTSGAASLAMIHLLLSTGISGTEPCQVVYFPQPKVLNLINDSGTDLVSPSGIVAGTGGILANSRCSVNTGLASGQLISKNSVRVTIPLTLQPGTFSGLKSVYVNAFDTSGWLTHWVQAATLAVP